MASLYLKMTFNLELFAADEDARQVLSGQGEETIEDITLHFKSGSEITKKHALQTYPVSAGD